MNCKRCNIKLKELGHRKFHEGAKLGFLGDLAELFVHREEFLLCFCEQCGEISFFIPDYEQKKQVRTFIEQHGYLKDNPRFKEFLKEDFSHKHLSRKDQESAFIKWLQKQNA